MKILMLGDSLIEYQDWSHHFPDATVFKRGMAGETVQGLLHRLPMEMERFSGVTVALVMSGTNNLAMDDLFFLPAYEEIVAGFQDKYPTVRVLVTSLLPVHFPWLADDAVLRMNQLLQQLVIRRQAAVAGSRVEYLDLYRFFLLDNGQVDHGCFLEDGVHLSERGYMKWVKVLVGTLE